MRVSDFFKLCLNYFEGFAIVNEKTWKTLNKQEFREMFKYRFETYLDMTGINLYLYGCNSHQKLKNVGFLKTLFLVLFWFLFIYYV